MPKILLHVIAAAAYAGLAVHFWRSRWNVDNDTGHRASRGGLASWERVVLGATVIGHSLLLGSDMLGGPGFRFGFAHALSVMALMAAMFYGIESLFYPLEGMPALVLPPAALCVFLPVVFEGTVFATHAAAPFFVAHVVVAMAAYAFIAIAAAHAILMAAVERRLHARGRAGPPLGLPPLLTMERLLFRILSAGFALLTLTLASGAVFSEEIFGRALRIDHKTVFGSVAWLIFAVLLIGRYAYGWRGRAAMNGTLAGFVVLMLAYVGSRFVLEVILERA